MRTTLNLDEDVFEILKKHSQSRGISLGKAASELVRTGIHGPTPTRIENGFVVFDIPAGPEKITSERVKKLLEAL